jgi:integrase
MVLNFAVREGLLQTNPASHVHLPRLGKARVGCFTHEEINAFCSVKDNYHYGDALSFDLYTGLRPEEIFALTENDVDFVNRILHIERACIWIAGSFRGFGSPKTVNSERKIGLTLGQTEFLRNRIRLQKERAELQKRLGLQHGEPALEKWIERYRRANAYLYPSRIMIFSNAAGQVPSDTSVRKNFKAMLRGAGFKNERLGLRLYDLRHTHASYLLMQGVQPIKVAERLGHTVAVLFMYYAHLIPDMLVKEPAEVFAENFKITW